MKSHSRLLKPSFLRSFLQDTLQALPPGFFAVVFNVERGVLASAGDAPLELALYDSSGIPTLNPEIPHIAQPLLLEQNLWGYFITGPSVGNQADPSLAEGPSRFIARSLNETLVRDALIRAMGEETLERYRESALMQRAVINLNRSMKFQYVVESLLHECDGHSFPCQVAMVFLKDGTLEHHTQFSQENTFSPTELAHIAESELFKEVIRERRGEIVNDLSADPRWENQVPGLKSMLITPLQAPRIALGVLVLASTDQTSQYRAVHLKRSETLASVTGVAMANAHHFEQVQQILMALIKAMATAIDSRDRLTAGHSQRVAQYALGLAQVVNENRTVTPDILFEENELQEIFYAGLLHDVGKIGVREEVLTKATRLPRTHLELIGLRLALWGEINSRPWEDIYARFEIINKAYDLTEEDVTIINRFSRESLKVAGSLVTILTPEERDRLLTPRGNLTPDEWQEIKRHPEESFRILKSIPFSVYFPNILTIILQHHERLDGSGYPYGIGQDKLLIQSLILAIVDVYDSLRRDRHYKKALSQEMALTILRQEARMGKLDPQLVQLFCDRIDKIESTITRGMALFPPRDFLQ